MKIRNITTGIELNSKAISGKNSEKREFKKYTLLAVLLLFSFVFLFQIKESVNSNQDLAVEKTEEVFNNEDLIAQIKMGDEFYKVASDGADIPAVEVVEEKVEQQQKVSKSFVTQPAIAATAPSAKQKTVENKEKFVTVNLSNSVGRTNPFVPTVDVNLYRKKYIPEQTALYPEPPKEIVSDTVAENLMSTTISGIMYDAFSPSAIISIEGQDHLVRKGDKINGYKILDITKDRVIVQNGTNVYRATVGEILTTEKAQVNFNNVYEIQKRFGGAAAPQGTKMIQIN